MQDIKYPIKYVVYAIILEARKFKFQRILVSNAIMAASDLMIERKFGRAENFVKTSNLLIQLLFLKKKYRGPV